MGKSKTGAEAKTSALPFAASRPTTREFHGETLADDHAWLRDANWREVMRDPARLSPDIRSYLEAENKYVEAAFEPFDALKRALVAEMRGRIKEDDSSVPSRDGPYAYSMRYREGGQHPLLCRVPSAGGPEELLLDGDALAKGLAYFQLGGGRHSPDHKLLAWSCDDAGSEYFKVRVRSLATGADLPDIVPDTTGGVVWTADANAFYYVKRDFEHRPTQVYRHKLGTPSETDELIYDEPDKGFFINVSDLQAAEFAVISGGDHETSEAHLLDLRDPAAKPRLVAQRKEGERYDVEHHPDLNGESTLLIHTNANGAEDFKIVTAPLANPGRENWRELVPHREGVLQLGIAILRDWLVRLERADGLPRIVVRRLADGDEHTIAFAEEAYSLGMVGGYEFDTDNLRFSYSSMTTPSEVWDYDMRTRARDLKKRQEVPSGHDPADYITRRILAPADDGETVPISILYRKGLSLDGSAPLLLYGYGAYGHAIPASFSTNRLSLVDRGFVYAIAHIRGGTDKGWRWYRVGKLAKKENTFRDFVAAAEHLIAQGFTSKGRIVAHGGSAGGMLMGAVANMRPELFGGILAEVPFVDVLNTMLDDTLPLTPPEWNEWGNPIVDKRVYDRIRAYSPYDNVKAQDYPAMLVLAGLTDPRVTYWEPAKWVARLRALKTDQNPLWLKTNMDAGHGGAAGRFDRLEEVALGHVFALTTAGLA
ncbi:MAG TPA: S9 family peptidase [Xanthobacteraceae bacterium]|nr:S9 family peptidase [Xanthobacteraceae bacterium]